MAKYPSGGRQGRQCKIKIKLKCLVQCVCVCVPPAHGANVSLLRQISLGNRMADSSVGKVSDYTTAGYTDE